MATVYVVTAGSGDSYRIERVYLDATGVRVRPGLNGIAPVEPVQVEEWQDGAPPAAYDGPYWRAEWWARVPVAKRRSTLRHTDEGERFDDFAIRQEWWTGDALPEAKVVRRELAGVPKIEVVGLSKEKVEEIFWDAVTQASAELAGVPEEIASATSCSGWNEMGMATRHCRPGASSSISWTDVTWNGSATTS